MEFKFAQTPISESELAIVEAQWGARLPEKLRATILAHNGAAILSSSTSYTIDSLISFSPHDEINIYEVLSFLAQQRRENLLPFGLDLNGNLFCLENRPSIAEPGVVLFDDVTFEITRLNDTFSDFWACFKST